MARRKDKKESEVYGTIFLIERIGWEYDDNSYFRGSGSHPDSAFFLEEIAEKICQEKNLQEIRRIGEYVLTEYVQDASHAFEEDEGDCDHGGSDEKTLFLKENFLNSSCEFVKHPKDIPDEVLLRVMEKFELTFYEVVPVDLVA